MIQMKDNYFNNITITIIIISLQGQVRNISLELLSINHLEINLNNHKMYSQYEMHIIYAYNKWFF